MRGEEVKILYYSFEGKPYLGLQALMELISFQTLQLK